MGQGNVPFLVWLSRKNSGALLYGIRSDRRYFKCWQALVCHPIPHPSADLWQDTRGSLQRTEAQLSHRRSTQWRV